MGAGGAVNKTDMFNGATACALSTPADAKAQVAKQIPDSMTEEKITFIF
jgi:hypothetical protein